jgi:membrane associated rhomboid family serine protease
MQFNSNQFSVPVVIKNILIINVFLYIATYFLGYKEWFIGNLSLFHYSSAYFKPWQFVTHMFMHGNFQHILFNMFGVWMFGSRLEQIWGPKRFLTFYMLAGLGAAVLHTAVSTYEISAMGLSPDIPVLGASGALFGVLAAFAMYWPNTELFLIFFPVPIKAKYFVLIYAGIELFLGVGGFQQGVAHFAHLGGALVGFLIVKYWNKNNRQSLY